MIHSDTQILEVLDGCCEAFTFPMMDNGYVYLAATRMVLFRSDSDWAMTIEVFGFSPRAGEPDTHVHTFASKLANRQTVDDYVSEDAFQQYLKNNPNNESRFLNPIGEGPWMDAEEEELVAVDAKEIDIRGKTSPLPSPSAYAELGIELEEAPRIGVFELCRALAASHRDSLLATDEELRYNILPEMKEILRLEEWNHPDCADGEQASQSKTFQELAKVLATGDLSHYEPGEPNTDWKNWPEGGTL